MAFLVFFFLSRKTHFEVPRQRRISKERTRPSMIAMKYGFNPLLIEYLFLLKKIVIVV
jgi:hypothetical protein